MEESNIFLVRHYNKERVLFPLAERLLSLDEKAELERWLKLD